MSSTRFIVHIGPTKTASTYLQKQLFASAASLAAHGIHLPAGLAPEGSPHVHHKLLNAVRDPAAFQPAKRHMAALRQAGHDRILISTEFLAELREDEIHRLRLLLGAGEVSIVYMCRRWSDRLRSVWYHKVQTGSTDTLDAFADRLIAHAHQARDVNYAMIWRRWQNVFGRDALHIVPVSNITDDAGDVFTRFCSDVLHIAEPPVPPGLGERVNVSARPLHVEIVRALNAYSLWQGRPPHTAMFAGFWGLMKTADLQPLHDAMGRHRTGYRLDDADARLDGIYERLHHYADRVAGPQDGAPLFTRRGRIVPTIAPDYLAVPGVLDRIRDLYARIADAGAAPQPGTSSNRPNATAAALG
jgi:hypothetical protein